MRGNMKRTEMNVHITHVNTVVNIVKLNHLRQRRPVPLTRLRL